jgi:two-component system, sensor histidine kinase and response regulator
MKQLVFFLVLFQVSFAQEPKTPERLVKLSKMYIAFEGQQNFDSISKMLYKYESLPDMILIEKQVLYFFKGNLNSRISKFDDALVDYKKSISFYDKSKKATRPYSICLAHIADLYFTKKRYKEANDYAFKAKQFIIKDYYFEYINIRMIIGYNYFLNKDYKNSLSYYNEVEKVIIENKDDCKLPELQIKKAQLISAKGDFNNAILLINKTIKKAIECKQDVIVKNARLAKSEILADNNQLKAALKEKDSVNIMEEKLDIESRNRKIDELETKYETKLKEQENTSLKQINLEKESTLKKQQWALIFSILGISILIGLLYFVYKLSKKQKETNKVLAIQNKKIEENNSSLNRLNILNQKIFSVISHDFKGPITTLKMMLTKNNEFIANDSPLKNYINDINNQLGQSDEMLDNLLGWAKTELGSDGENKSQINLKNTIEIACKELFYKAKEKKIIINNLIDENISINFNASVLNIVLRNIINNAIKFSFENGVIDVSFHENCISIKDYGKGIEPKKLEKLFQQNVNPGLGTQYESGFGLGLYLCSELINKNKGSISATNNQDKGCTFKIILPN